ncbi:hypothetical protein BD65_530 [Yersinia ruckeri]|uniref:DUF799 domain-containing protein n=1 Tax=Yersinia ruckeri TaxID=29486 RepID=UPI0005AD1327|nr:DUF799 domain-containing protein [Yersinia ruckeri]AJI94911.1 hypothetical protein BD65_530 [Yersinia ruckeri]MCW6568090.1 DUF799 domain-containing protein [Yersinia ruckeri]
MKTAIGIFSLMMVLLLTGCAKPVARDYSAFKQSQVKSILVLPPVNHTPDVNASHGLQSQVTYPLAEAGYYVMPVAVVEETFRQNGLTAPEDIRGVSAEKLRQIFGADAVLYLDITEYGSSYMVITSETRVTASAKLVDLRTGKELWSASATASSNEQSNNSGGNVIGILVAAVAEQIINAAMDKSHDVAGITSKRLLAAGTPNGLLYGPRSPLYAKNGL